MNGSGGLATIEITGYLDSEFTTKAPTPNNPLTLCLSPDTHIDSLAGSAIDAPERQRPSGALEFSATATETLELDFIFDGTGVLPNPLGGAFPAGGVSDQIDEFKDLVYALQGPIHGPCYLELVWGALSFRCRLSKLDLSYTMFAPDGTALRANATAEFVLVSDEPAFTGDWSPTTLDLTHTSVANETPRIGASGLGLGVDIEDEEAIFVDNAGLVIAWPFFRLLFERLDLLDPADDFKVTVSPAGQSRAVHVLQYLVDGSKPGPEAQLMLSQVLCGMPVDDPVDLSIELTEHERSICDELLLVVLAMWSALGSTSADGLREAFLQRDGRLLRTADGWDMSVERGPVDVLLDRIPWSISIVRLPWMEAVVRTEWR